MELSNQTTTHSNREQIRDLTAENERLKKANKKLGRALIVCSVWGVLCSCYIAFMLVYTVEKKNDIIDAKNHIIKNKNALLKQASPPMPPGGAMVCSTEQDQQSGEKVTVCDVYDHPDHPDFMSSGTTVGSWTLVGSCTETSQYYRKMLLGRLKDGGELHCGGYWQKLE